MHIIRLSQAMLSGGDLSRVILERCKPVGLVLQLVLCLLTSGFVFAIGFALLPFSISFFYHFSVTFNTFRRLLPLFGDFYHFSVTFDLLFGAI